MSVNDRKVDSSVHKIYAVFDVAGYIVNTNIDKGVRMRQRRLDMFLYFAQMQSIVSTGEPIFDSTIFVHSNNLPYTEWLNRYWGTKYKILTIPRIKTYWDTSNGILNLEKKPFNPQITPYDRKLLDDVINTLNPKSNRELQDKIAMHGLASKANFNGDRIITKKMMLDFCKKSK
jgi:hypothetical protein